MVTQSTLSSATFLKLNSLLPTHPFLIGSVWIKDTVNFNDTHAYLPPFPTHSFIHLLIHSIANIYLISFGGHLQAGLTARPFLSPMNEVPVIITSATTDIHRAFPTLREMFEYSPEITNFFL